MSDEHLRQWLLRFLAEFREKFEKLPPEVRNAASRTLVDLSAPCQFLVIWAKNPEFQIVVVTHLSELDDKLIQIHGPIENQNLTDYIPNEVFNSPAIKIMGVEKFEDILATTLRWSIGIYYNPLVGHLQPGIYEKSRLSTDAVMWIVIGNLTNLNVEEMVDKFVNEISLSAQPQPLTPPREEKLILEGFGTYIYPPIWIGEPPKPRSFKEKVWGIPLWFYARERVLTDSYKSRSVIVTRDGYIAIGEKDRPKAQELLNEIMGALLLAGIPVNAIREIDLGETSFTESGGSRFNWNPISPRTWLYLSYPGELPLPFPGRTAISEEKIRRVIKLAEVLTSDSRMKTIMSLFLEANTYFMNTEYKQALIISWIILEDFYIKDLWTFQISRITSDKERINKLMSWAVDARLEALSISNFLKKEEYESLMRIKDVRNEVVHEGKMPQKEVVEDCLKLISKVVRDYVGKHLGERLSELW